MNGAGHLINDGGMPGHVKAWVAVVIFLAWLPRLRDLPGRIHCHVRSRIRPPVSIP